MSGNRIRLLDILRGFAILGTLGTNIWIFAFLGDLNYFYTFNQHVWWDSLNDYVRMLVLFFVNGKLLGLLTIMFGVGLYLKYEQALKKGKAWPGLYIWTSIILILEGFIHYTLVMEYDILMSYGITAIIVAFIVKRGNNTIRRSMMVIGSIHGLLMLIILGVGIYLAIIDTHISIGDMKEGILLYNEGSYFEQVIYRLTHFISLRLEAIFVIPMNIFLFLLGITLIRSGYFSPDVDGRKKRRKLLKYGMIVGIPLNLLIFIPGGYFDLPVRYLFAPIMSLGYIGLIAWLVEANDRLWLWKRLEQVGKMALSCYVLQNIIASYIFYGWGLGLGGRLNAVEVVIVWIAICLLQLVFAALWLNWFKLGPMELARRYTSSLVTIRSRS